MRGVGVRLIAVVAMLALGLVACVGPAGRAQRPPQIIKFGAIYPLTGSLATVGVRSKNAVELAVDIINKKTDIDLPFAATEGVPALGGAKLEVVFADSQGSPETAMAEAERLITSGGVVALQGCFQSAATKTASHAAERLQTPFINADSISPALAERGFQWFFQTTPDANTFVENWFRFLNELQERKGIPTKALKLALLYENTDAGTDTRVAQEKFAEKYGYTVTARIPYPHQASDVTSEVMQLKAANAEVIMQVSYTPDAILLIRGMEDLGYSPQAILAWDSGHSDPAFLKAVGPDGEHILVGEVWSGRVAGQKPVVKAVNDMFRERYGQDMDGSSARAFTAVFVLADALQRAASTEKAKIRDGLRATNMSANDVVMAWDGVKFDENGRNVLAGNIITQIQGGQYAVVWPLSLAEADVVWPFPAWSAR